MSLAGRSRLSLEGQLRTEILEAIRVIHASGRRVPPGIAADLGAHLGEDSIPEREIEVLRSVA
jgi:DNA-binding NarL/FixJ family response regulator